MYFSAFAFCWLGLHLWEQTVPCVHLPWDPRAERAARGWEEVWGEMLQVSPEHFLLAQGASRAGMERTELHQLYNKCLWQGWVALLTPFVFHGHTNSDNKSPNYQQ